MLRCLLLLLPLFTVAAPALVHGHEPAENSIELQHGPRGMVELDWRADHITRAITAGYPDAFGLSSFFRRVPPKVVTVDGKVCIQANFVALDIDDAWASDIDERVEVTLDLHAPGEFSLIYGYDGNGLAETGGEMLIAGTEGRPWHQVTLRLERARFANRGMADTDLVLLNLATLVPGIDDGQSTLTLCGVSLKRPYPKTLEQPNGRASLRFIDADTDTTTPIRLGIYHDNGRLELDFDQLISVPFYDTQTKLLSLRNYAPRSQPWPHPNRYVAYSDGSYDAELPAGEYVVVASKGFEYRWVTQRFKVEEGETTKLNLRLERWRSMPELGWYSGDVHVHMSRTERDDADIHALSAAEDLHFTNLLLMQNPAASHFEQYAYGERGDYVEGLYALISGVEGPRTAQRGHTIALDISAPVALDSNEFLYHEFFKQYHAQGAITGYAHVGSMEFNASWGLALDVPFDLVDFVEIMQNSDLRTGFWYEFLNLGYSISPAAGSDYPYFDQAGAVRSYAFVGDRYSPKSWFSALKEGRTFVSNGPVMKLEVNDHTMGDRVEVAEETELKIRARAAINPDLDRLLSLELIHCGEVVQRVEAGGRDKTELAMSVDYPAVDGGWLALRVTGENYAMAHSAPVYLLDAKGSSACRAKVPALVATMKERLQLLKDTPLEPARELEYWEVDGLAESYADQLPELHKRIGLAMERYDVLLQRFAAQ